MLLTVTTLSDQIFTLEVGEDLDLASFKGLCEIEVNVPAEQIALLWNGRPLHDDKLTLKQYGISNGDMLLLQQIQGQRGQGVGGGAPGSSGNTKYCLQHSFLKCFVEKRPFQPV